MWTVRIEWYSLMPHNVGEPTGECREWKHKAPKAALRRLGSLISGKLQKEANPYGSPARYYIIDPSGKHWTWTDLRIHLFGDYLA